MIMIIETKESNSEKQLSVPPQNKIWAVFFLFLCLVISLSLLFYTRLSSSQAGLVAWRSENVCVCVCVNGFTQLSVCLWQLIHWVSICSVSSERWTSHSCLFGITCLVTKLIIVSDWLTHTHTRTTQETHTHHTHRVFVFPSKYVYVNFSKLN